MTTINGTTINSRRYCWHSGNVKATVNIPSHVTDADRLEAATFGSLSKRSPGAINGTGLGPMACIARNRRAPTMSMIPTLLSS